MILSFRLRLNFRVSKVRLRSNSTNIAARMVKSESEEGLLCNGKDGYYAVSAGAMIVGDEGERFEAVRKLGWGINSTVWMGRNCSNDAVPKYAALKILSKSATGGREPLQNNELQMLLRTYTGKEPEHRSQTPLYEEQGLDGPPHPGWYRVSGFLGAFTSNNSQHLVIVSPLYGEHMRSYMLGEPGKRLQQAFVKQIARQTLQALDFLHSQCGIIHSDVKPENILRDFNLGPQIDDIVEALRNKEPNAGRDGHSAPLWLPHVDDPNDLDIVLVDLSHASWKDLILHSPRAIGSPALKAPELVLGFAFTTAIDIWAFGCTIFELLAGTSLFRFPEPRSPNELGEDPRYHLSLMQSLIGEPFFPQAAEGTLTKGFLDNDGRIKSPAAIGETLDERIANDLDGVQNNDLLVAFLRRCLRLDPGNRALAIELLEDPWLTSA